MRILQVDSGREWRGGQNQVRLLCRELMREPGVELRLVTKRGGDLARRTRAVGVPVHEVPWTIGPDPRAWWALAHFARAFRPEVIHVHDSHALLAGLYTRRWISRGRRPGLFGINLAWLLYWRRAMSGLETPSLVATRRVDFHVGARSPWRQVDRIVAISNAVRGVLTADGISEYGVTVVPSGIDPEEVLAAAGQPFDIRRRLGLSPGTPLAVNVAALVDHKDQPTLIRAAAHARAMRPDLHWAIAGDGELRDSLGAEIRRRGLADRVHLLGYVEAADALIREADVFVMSSKEEGLGSVILNALALGKPVVATAGGGIPEILPPEALVPVGDAEGLARKVVRALDHPTPVPFPPRFTARAMAQGVLAVYRSLL